MVVDFQGLFILQEKHKALTKAASTPIRAVKSMNSLQTSIKVCLSYLTCLQQKLRSIFYKKNTWEFQGP